MSIKNVFAALAIAALSSSSAYALGSQISLGSRSIFLYPIGESAQKKIKLTSQSKTSVSFAALTGAQLGWHVSDDIALTLGSYAGLKPITYNSITPVDNLPWIGEVLGKVGDCISSKMKPEEGRFQSEEEWFNSFRAEAAMGRGSKFSPAEVDAEKAMMTLEEGRLQSEEGWYNAFRAEAATGRGSEFSPAEVDAEEDKVVKFIMKFAPEIAKYRAQAAAEKETVKNGKKTEVSVATKGKLILDLFHSIFQKLDPYAGPLPNLVAKTPEEVAKEAVDRKKLFSNSELQEAGLPTDFALSISLRQHIPILVGAQYKLYSAGPFSLGVYGQVGLGIWSASAALRADHCKAMLLVESAESSFSPVALAGVNAGCELGAATLDCSFGYGYFGEPNPQWGPVVRSFLPPSSPRCAVHGLVGSVGIGFEF